jgi:hypothetical protein
LRNTNKTYQNPFIYYFYHFEMNKKHKKCKNKNGILLVKVSYLKMIRILYLCLSLLYRTIIWRRDRKKMCMWFRQKMSDPNATKNTTPSLCFPFAIIVLFLWTIKLINNELCRRKMKKMKIMVTLIYSERFLIRRIVCHVVVWLW